MLRDAPPPLSGSENKDSFSLEEQPEVKLIPDQCDELGTWEGMGEGGEGQVLYRLDTVWWRGAG